MKAHRVRCQLCAHGVTVVRAEPHDIGFTGEDEDGAITKVFAGALTEKDAIDKMAVVVAEEETEARNAMLEEGEDSIELTPEEIKKTWSFKVSSMPIRP